MLFFWSMAAEKSSTVVLSVALLAFLTRLMFRIIEINFRLCHVKLIIKITLMKFIFKITYDRNLSLSVRCYNIMKGVFILFFGFLCLAKQISLEEYEQ